MVFCSSQTLPNGDIKEVAMDHIERQGPDPQHLADPPDDQNTIRMMEGGNAHTLPTVPMIDDDGDEMADDEDSIVQEMPLALIEDVTGQ